MNCTSMTSPSDVASINAAAAFHVISAKFPTGQDSRLKVYRARQLSALLKQKYNNALLAER
jgi:hypothetical protein